MSRFRRRLAFGAELLDPERTRFRLWAPACERAVLEIEGRAPLAMARDDDGWFELEADCGAHTRYRYRVRPELAVPDPAARAQAEDVHGPSLVVDPEAYRWRVPDWRGRPWDEAVIYELHAGLLGGFDGVAGRLEDLKDLGVTAVELMPVADFPGRRNWGYDGVLPYAPDRAYGTPDQLKALVDRAHELGLMILLDVVYNHFGPDGNYLAAYAPGFFRQDHHTPWGGAIDFRRQPVRTFFIENALYWLMEYRVDGLRFDAVHAIDHPTFVDEMASEIRRSIEPDRQVHLILEHEANVASHLRRGFDAQWNDDVHHVLHVMLTGEHHGYYRDYVEAPAEKLARALATGFVYQGQTAPLRGGPRGEPSGELAVTAFVDCLQNHDQIGNRAFGQRLTTLADPEALRAAVGLLVLSPHIPMLFMGEDTGSRSPFYYFTDHGPALARAVRQGRRREFAHFPEFADPQQLKRIPDPNAPSTFEASKPASGPDAAAWRRLYSELLAIRRTRVVPGLKGATSIEARVLADKAVLAQWRLGGGARLSLALNLGETSAALRPVPGELLYAIGCERPAGRLPAPAFAAWLEPSA
jgi:malto-oligosyltrehalose trehalohydrolase